ncbi:VCBS repeat-containing protein [Pseudoruegeria sp. HB172150]|uniref:FG-GAP repeat domain-containing protein n=1 Tax=Pseudoruegeria sp. HB172150 TaxID=2721164 RepID=UPI001555BF81|nr:VCBS repeat-containing protein [Pseudoruegeria sp. HB172150]
MKALVALLCLTGAGAAACEAPAWRETDYPGSVVTDATKAGPVGRAWFADPVTRYQHGILGRDTEPETLWVDAEGNQGTCGHSVTLDKTHVFEDIAPRLVDLDGDGTNEVIVVRSHVRQGAHLAVYRWTGSDLILDAATPYIGTSHRWLAPLGAADLDGDGLMELAYVDRPHLARTLRVWRYEDGELTEIAAASGLTNHRIGQDHISGGIRDCGQGLEIVTADGGWSRLVASRLKDGRLEFRDIGAFDGPASFAAALACD